MKAFLVFRMSLTALLLVSSVLAWPTQNNANGNGGVFSYGTGNTVNVRSQSCINGVCRSQTCINGMCYNQNIGSVNIYGRNNNGGTCPAVVCDDYCRDLVIWNDNCPICMCSGRQTATREPCHVQADCSSDGVCQNSICRYSNVPGDLQRACQFDFECKSNENCKSSRCSPGAKIDHVEGVSCVFQHQCPSGTTCHSSKMTCYEARGTNHQEGVSCVFDHQCESGYSCQNMSCLYTGRQQGRTRCTYDSQCRRDEECINRTCVPTL